MSSIEGVENCSKVCVRTLVQLAGLVEIVRHVVPKLNRFGAIAGEIFFFFCFMLCGRIVDETWLSV